jgi:hypothetical protein
LLDSSPGKPAIVAGNGRGVFDEVNAARTALGPLAVIYAANDVGVYLPHVDHFCSLHATKLDLWVALRRDAYCRPAGNAEFREHDTGLMGAREERYQWKGLTPTLPLSGLFAAQIAYLMGCSPVVLCGCPCDDTPCFFQAECTNRGYKESQATLKAEMDFKPEFKKAMRSMSGWSKEFLGGI